MTHMNELDDLLARLAKFIVAEQRAQQPPPEPDPNEWLTPAEAAAVAKLSAARLETLRRVGGGPRFTRDGRRVRYLRADVNAWLGSKRPS